MKHICKRCGQKFYYKLDNTYWDEHGFGYTTKLVKCTFCSCPNVLEHVEDKNLDINNDKRFYEYDTK